KTIVEDQKEKFLSIKSKLKEIEDFLREKKENLHSIEFSDLEYIKKVNEIYEEIKHKVTNIGELENDNNSENNKIIIYTEKISYLIERIKFLLKDEELYEYESDYDLSEEMNKKALDEVNNYITRIKEKRNKSKTILKDIEVNVGKNKDIFVENKNTLLSIYSIIKSINEIREGYQRKAIEHDKKNKIRDNIDKTIKKEDENISINNDIGKTSLRDDKNIELNENGNHNGNKGSDEKNNRKEENKFGSAKVKLSGGILCGLLISSCVIITTLYKSKSVGNDINEEEILEEYEANNDLFNSCKHDEVIEVTFTDYE
ncbi:reticulocyte binding protein, putative, partial [Plasmodium relictum]